MDVPAPAFTQVPTGIQENVESTSQGSSQHGSQGMWVTRALPNVGPLMGDGVGAEDKALPAVGALAGLPSAVPPLVLGQVRAL